MSDPSIEAAQRAGSGWYSAREVEAAREALRPVREKWEAWNGEWELGPTWDVEGNAQHVIQLLLKDLAPLIYTTEELERLIAIDSD